MCVYTIHGSYGISCKEQLDCMEWDIWYDFFGIPQVSGSEKHMDGFWWNKGMEQNGTIYKKWVKKS